MTKQALRRSPRRRAAAALACALALPCMAVTAEPALPWGGPGWYQVLATPAGPRLQAGPYKTELACKKAMNAASPTLSCRELDKPPPVGGHG